MTCVRCCSRPASAATDACIARVLGSCILRNPTAWQLLFKVPANILCRCVCCCPPAPQLEPPAVSLSSRPLHYQSALLRPVIQTTYLPSSSFVFLFQLRVHPLTHSLANRALSRLRTVLSAVATIGVWAAIIFSSIAYSMSDPLLRRVIRVVFAAVASLPPGRCCWLLSFSLLQRSRTLTSLASCRAGRSFVFEGDGPCDALAVDQVNQMHRVYELLGERFDDINNECPVCIRLATKQYLFCVQTGAVQWSDTVSSFSTCAAYIILVSVFLITAAALFVEVTRDRPSALQQPLVVPPSSSAQLLSRLSLQVTAPPPRFIFLYTFLSVL